MAGGYQTDTGLQGHGKWSGEGRRRHTVVRELLVSLLFLLQQARLAHMHVYFHMDSVVAVHCVRRMGLSRSLPLLRASEWLFAVAAPGFLTLSPVHLPGRFSVRADALSGTSASSLEWSLHQDCLQDLQELFGEPGVDLFHSTSNRLFPSSLTGMVLTAVGSLAVRLTDWHTWRCIYLFPPSTTYVMKAVCRRLENY